MITKTKKRLYRVKYLHRDTTDSIFRGRERTDRLTVEVIHAFAACVVGEKVAMRVCRDHGDRKFVRVVAVKEVGEVHHG